MVNTFTFVNMPNTCFNILTVGGDGYKRFIRNNTIQNKMVMEDPPSILFEFGVPTNFSTERTVACEHWGSWITSGGRDCSDWEGNKVKFQTAFSPPIQYVLSVSKKYPKFTFTLDFEEFSMGIWGTLVVKNGVELSRITRRDEYMKRVHNRDIDDDTESSVIMSPMAIIGQMASILGHTPNNSIY